MVISSRLTEAGVIRRLIAYTAKVRIAGEFIIPKKYEVNVPNFLSIDGLTGQLTHDFAVELVGRDLVFTPVSLLSSKEFAAREGCISAAKARAGVTYEGSDLYTRMANLLDYRAGALVGYEPVNVSDSFGAPVGQDLLLPEADDEFVALANEIGPLFGLLGMMDGGKIVEPLSAWYQAADNIGFAVRTLAVINGRAKPSTLDCSLYFALDILPDDGQMWQVYRPYHAPLSQPYKQFLTLSDAEEEELSRTQNFGKDGCDTGPATWAKWILEFPAGGLRVPMLAAVFLSKRGVPNVPLESLYMSGSYAAKMVERTYYGMLEQLFGALLNMHSRNIRTQWTNSMYAARYAMPLERIWNALGIDSSAGKVGICEHCGHVFIAKRERKDRKRFCSQQCQERAKAKRTYDKKRAASLK